MAASGSKTFDSEFDSESESELTLPECFDLVFKLHQDLETTNESTSSDQIQKRLRDGTILCERAIRIVNELNLFSFNEEIEEVSTNEVRYMLLSAFLAYLSGLNTHLPRIMAVNKSKLCYSDFLKLLKSYGVINFYVDLPEDDEETSEIAVRQAPPRHQDVNALSAQRNSKIQRFKEKKAMEKQLADLKVYMDKEHVDDEIKREFYLMLLKHWANRAVDEIDSCNLELEMLKHREAMIKEGNGYGMMNKLSYKSEASKSKPFRPFILTKTKLQKQVFGAGYPSLPTMTVDEFYEEKLKEGTLSESVQGHSLQNWAMDPDKDAEDRDREDAEKEHNVENDDPEALQRARAMDDWKDDHRRGEGNRYNKG
uniref:Immunoglobulin-binding protein 1 n=1 Tax=Arion vulgaris TaxID=1028688 RepID=A0A0B7AP58_9EUPU